MLWWIKLVYPYKDAKLEIYCEIARKILCLYVSWNWLKTYDLENILAARPCYKVGKFSLYIFSHLSCDLFFLINMVRTHHRLSSLGGQMCGCAELISTKFTIVICFSTYSVREQQSPLCVYDLQSLNRWPFIQTQLLTLYNLHTKSPTKLHRRRNSNNL